ncbi:hypothetical protein BCV69DRAFT_285288 [Microstroma glucosiphilum]|uniref:Uncharacterized protein n=1 Tax=Pseudomicrostroma glucosiphilum TaxID=1684307 RepID=A0A316TZ56_9BASI|nr:hypothetical protein BCV69DRAFT_285288 [Pseudomicrostroma glucosiphilum]PWN18320.1 hypothetical protein BCV69DRAFT_285288 [Pseudomicrostroma glucosiphilum]
MEMLRSFSSTSSASDEEAALDATAGETSTVGGTAARSQVPRRSIAHNPSFLAEAGYSGSSSSSAPTRRGGPAQASSSAGLPPPPSPGFGGPPAEWDEVDLEFDVDLEMARNGSSGGIGAEGRGVRGGRVRSLSGRGEGGEQVPMQKLGSGTGRSNVTRGGSQLQESRTDKETNAMADGTGTGAGGATSSSMGEYDATPKPSMDARLPPAGEEEGDGALRGLHSEGPSRHRRTTSTSSSQGKPSKTRILDRAGSGSGSDAVRRAEVDPTQPGPPSYTPRARTLEKEIGYSPSLEEGEDEDEDEYEDEDATTPTARHLDRSYLDSSSAGRGSPSRLDFEPLTRREKWTHALTAVVVTVLAGLAVAIGGDLIDWPGDGIGDS